jgi:hypothetical protein
MALTSTSASGVEYRLRDALFEIRGPQNEDVLSEDYLGQASILVSLRGGDYQVTLQPGWRMEHRAPPLTAWTEIPAVLASPNPLAVTVPVDQVAPAIFLFQVEEGLIVFATGILDISVEVDEVGSGGGGGTGGGASGGTGGTPTPDPVTQIVPVVTSNNLDANISELPYELTVTPLGPVVDGVPVDFSITGVAVFPASFLNGAMSAIPGLTEVTVNGLTATPYIRSGAVGAPADLTTLTSADPIPAIIPIPIVDLPESAGICGPLNLDICPNTCTDGTPCNQGSTTCNAIGDGTCVPRGACICAVEPLLFPLSTDVVTVTPSGASGEILFGWNEDLLPPQLVIVTNPPGPNGMRVLAAVLNIGLEGWMGKLTSPSTAGPLLDSELLSIPISGP